MYGEPVLAPQDSPGHPLAYWLQYWREERAHERRLRARERGGRPPARRTRAIVTMVHNEGVFLPIWLRYYSRFFAPEDIYVLDNGTTDGSTDRDGFVRIPVEHDSVDHVWMMETIRDLQHDLIDRYDLVVVTDVDEIVCPVPEVGSLAAYLDHFDDAWVNCLGYELLHMKDSEPPIDLDRPILEQRGHWFPDLAYNKPAVATVAMDWVPGFHIRSDHQSRIDPDLRLVHLHRMDFDLCLERHEIRRRKEWADEDEQHGWAVHNQIVDPVAFERWFYGESAVPDRPPQPEPIPPNWVGAF